MSQPYLPLYIRIGQSGVYTESMTYSRTIDTRDDFGLWVKSVPFVHLPEIKNIISQDWKDQDGEDTFIPAHTTTKAYDIDITFVYLSPDDQSNVRINQFIDTIRGKWLKLYDTYTRTSRSACYLLKSSEHPIFLRRSGKDYVQFTLTFRCNNPSNHLPL